MMIIPLDSGTTFPAPLNWRACAKPDLPTGRAFVDPAWLNLSSMLSGSTCPPGVTALPRSGLAHARLFCPRSKGTSDARPRPVLDPPFNTIRLSHVALNVADLAASRAFYVDALGLQVTDETATHLYLRAMEERGHHSVILQKSPDPGQSKSSASRFSRKTTLTAPTPISAALADPQNGSSARIRAALF